MTITRTTAILAASCALGLVACDDDSPKPGLAPTASALASAAPASAQAYELRVKTAGSKVSFTMEAPLERIHGELANALSGEIFLDPTDLGKTRALIRVDLDQLVLFQQKRADAKQEYGERSKSDLQNQHARTWLQISEDGDTAERKQNAVAQFSLTELTQLPNRDLTQLSGDPRRVVVTAAGELLLHQRKAKKTVELSLEVALDEGRPKTVRVRSRRPMIVNLEEHDVRPRATFSKLAEKTLAALGSKVNKEPRVSIEFDAALVAAE